MRQKLATKGTHSEKQSAVNYIIKSIFRIYGNIATRTVDNVHPKRHLNLLVQVMSFIFSPGGTPVTSMMSEGHSIDEQVAAKNSNLRTVYCTVDL